MLGACCICVSKTFTDQLSLLGLHLPPSLSLPSHMALPASLVAVPVYISSAHPSCLLFLPVPLLFLPVVAPYVCQTCMHAKLD